MSKRQGPLRPPSRIPDTRPAYNTNKNPDHQRKGKEEERSYGSTHHLTKRWKQTSEDILATSQNPLSDTTSSTKPSILAIAAQRTWQVSSNNTIQKFLRKNWSTKKNWVISAEPARNAQLMGNTLQNALFAKPKLRYLTAWKSITAYL